MMLNMKHFSRTRDNFEENNIKAKKLRIDLKCREMRPKVTFGYPKWPPMAIFIINFLLKLCIDLKKLEWR